MAKRNGKPKKKPREKSGKDLKAANRVRANEFEKRVEAVRKLLCHGHRPHEIAVAIMDNYAVSEKTAYNYLLEARRGLRDLADGDSGQLFDQCLGILMGVVSSPKSNGMERIGAVREINRMCGHHRPVTLNVGTGPDQGPLTTVNILAFLESGETTPVIGKDEVMQVLEGKMLESKEKDDVEE